MRECTYNGWLIQNIQYKEWYLKNYSNLKKFPLSMLELQNFYTNDMNDRNLEPSDTYLNCYDFLFSYYLGNFNIDNKFSGQGFLGRTFGNLIPSISKTYNDITGTVNFYLYMGMGIIGLLVVLNLLKVIRGK